jgi:hypothetical protein
MVIAGRLSFFAASEIFTIRPTNIFRLCGFAVFLTGIVFQKPRAARIKILSATWFPQAEHVNIAD